MNTLHGWITILYTPLGLFFIGVNSVTKFASTCPSTEFLGLYLISNDLSLVPHSAILLVKLDILAKIAVDMLLMRTWCALENNGAISWYHELMLMLASC